jgi:lysophospholipid acyltransferase (LPLAT)-like uncharacterized protein
MRTRNHWLQKLCGLTLAVGTRGWMSTLDYRGCYYDPRVDPTNSAFCGPAIFLLWHEYIPFPLYLRGHCNIAMLLSRHHDAEWLSVTARYMGFDTVRGSTNRGGVTALRQLWRKSRSANLAMTPDGPRGPRRRLAPGAVYLASRLSIPLVAIGLGYDRPWRLPTWDRFAIPRPYSRARAMVSPPIHLPADLDREGLERHRRWLESTLNQLTTDAERWAQGGYRVEGQLLLQRRSSGPRRPDARLAA